jgi:TPR repeat protein
MTSRMTAWTIGILAALSTTMTIAQPNTRPRPAPTPAPASTAAPETSFTPRPLPPQTRDNLAKWGLTESNWLTWTQADFAVFDMPDQTKLEEAAKAGDDPVALVLLVMIQRLETDVASTVDAAAGMTGNAIDAAAGRTSNAIDAAAGAAVNAVDAAAAAATIAAAATELQDSPENTERLSKAILLGDPRAQWLRAERLILSQKLVEVQQGRALFRLAAEGGVVPAMEDLAVRLVDGRGFQENKVLAATWARRCADLGNFACMALTADALDAGWAGVKQPNEATVWVRRAAELGETWAMVQMGSRHEAGVGVDLNFPQAVAWYRRAANAGDSNGMVSLGIMLNNGRGVPKNDGAAVGWFRRAADSGDPSGMLFLGFSLSLGQGVERNKAAALGWFKRAAEAGLASGMHMYAISLEPTNKEGAAYWYGEAIASNELDERSQAQATDALVALEGQGIIPERP